MTPDEMRAMTAEPAAHMIEEERCVKYFWPLAGKPDGQGCTPHVQLTIGYAHGGGYRASLTEQWVKFPADGSFHRNEDAPWSDLVPVASKPANRFSAAIFERFVADTRAAARGTASIMPGERRRG